MDTRHRSRAAAGRRTRALVAGGLAAVTGTGALVGLSGTALADNPPLGPGNIEIFNHRDMVALEGYAAQAGETATVTVSRNGRQIGIGRGVLDETGFLEFNHPGGECWIGVTPDIRGGDLVEVSFSEAPFVDGAIVGSAVITSVTASPVEPTPDIAGDVEGTVTIRGTYGPDIDPNRFVVEVVNPDMREAGSAIGERAIGWIPVEDPEHPNGGPGFTATGTFAEGEFTAVFGLQSASDQELVLAAEHVALSWMADGAADLALGATQYEFGETDGPGFGGCPPGPGAQPPVAPSTATLTTSTGGTAIDVCWAAPEQPVDAGPITAYRVSALDVRYPGQEVSVRTGTTSASIQGLVSGQPYEVTIEAYNGQWSSPARVGTATPGTGGNPGPGGETGGPTSVPAAPTGATATATGLTSVDLGWTASPGADSYEITAASTAEGAALPSPVSVTAPATGVSLPGLSEGTEYTFSITASNSAGQSPAATVTVTTPAPVAPGAARVTRVLPAHEGLTLEWIAATPGNAFSPVTGYDLVATPADGGPAVTVQVGAVGSGTVTGLRNGVSYTHGVFARSGDLRGPAATVATGVPTSAVPNDQVTVGRARYRADRREWRVLGTAQDTTGNTVTVRTSTGALVGTSTVAADGTWSVIVRNGPAAPADNGIVVTSASGARTTATITRIR